MSLWGFRSLWNSTDVLADVKHHLLLRDISIIFPYLSCYSYIPLFSRFPPVKTLVSYWLSCFYLRSSAVTCIRQMCKWLKEPGEYFKHFPNGAIHARSFSNPHNHNVSIRFDPYIENRSGNTFMKSPKMCLINLTHSWVKSFIVPMFKGVKVVCGLENVKSCWLNND